MSAKHYLNLRIYFPTEEIEFFLNGKDVLGIVEEVNIRKNKLQTSVWY
jgi:hypothetical protein